MVKKWCTWKRVKVNDNFYKDPNTFEFNENIKFTETIFQDGENIFAGIIEGSEKDIKLFCNNHPEFSLQFKLEKEIKDLINEWYSDYKLKKNKTNPVNIVNGIIQDNRYFEEL